MILSPIYAAMNSTILSYMADDYTTLEFKDSKSWRNWLMANHDILHGVWLRLFKKGSDKPTTTYAEALDEALCFGWIDGQTKRYDEQSYLQKFTPRRKRSTWSKRNIEHVERLTSQGHMMPSGLAEIERAKADGRWDAAYDPPSSMQLPDDLYKALDHNSKAKEFFDTLSKSRIYTIGFQLQTAKKAETKKRRIASIIKKLENGEV